MVRYSILIGACQVITDNPDTNRRIVEAIEKLRANEGDSIAIPNDNADFGGPNTLITVYAEFGPATRFYGDSLLDCLEQAVAARKKI